MGKKSANMKNPLLHLLETNIEFKESYVKARDAGFHIHAVTKTPEEWSGLSQKEREDRMWYQPFCTLDEIERIFSPKDAKDLLLKYRADSILSNMRILRTFEKRACYVKESEWTLADQFDDSIFEVFINSISKRYRKNINDILFGTLFSDDPNGYCIKTAFGPIIVLSEALNKFLYFMNLSFYPLWYGAGKVYRRTVGQSLLIGLRTMLLTEAFDFEMDPRGSPPEPIDSKLREITTAEMLFVIAHEYAHFLLNHLDDRGIIERTMSYTLPSESHLAQKALPVYTQSHKQEFEADSFAVKILSGDDPNKKRDILLFAVTVMSYLDIFESLTARIARTRRNTTSVESHPSASKRRRKLMRMGKKRWDQDKLATSKAIVQASEVLKKFVIRLYIENPSALVNYGSVYLDQWRGKPKIDRIDY